MARLRAFRKRCERRKKKQQMKYFMSPEELSDLYGE